MRSNIAKILAGAAIPLFLGACCVTPSKPAAIQTARFIPLSEAIMQVQNAVAESRKSPPDRKIGVLVSKVTISLKISASDTEGGTTGATIGIVLPPVSVGGTVTETSTKLDSSENTITLEFSSPFLAGKDTILAAIINETDSKRREAMLKNLEVLQPVETIR
jgi:hypothetical protein